MKDIKELETMTFWEITSNEGALTQFVLGIGMVVLGILFLFTDIYYKLKYMVRRH